MAYFANGTDGMNYLEQVCYNCKNWRDMGDGRGWGCPVMDLHYMYSYQLCNSKALAKWMLDYLIPDEPKVGQKTCVMFLAREELHDPKQKSWIENNKLPLKERMKYEGGIPE